MSQSYLVNSNTISPRRGFDPNKNEQHYDFLSLLFDKMTPRERSITKISITNDLLSIFINEFILDRIYEFTMSTYLRYRSVDEIKNSDIIYSLANHSCNAYQLLELMTFTPIAAVIQKYRPHISFENVLSRFRSDYDFQLQYLYDLHEGTLPDSDTILSQIYNRKKDKNSYEEKILGDISTPSTMFQQTITYVDFDLTADIWHFDPCVGRGVSLLTTKKYFVNVLNIDEKKVLEKLIGYDNDLSKCYLASAILDPNQLTSSRIYYKDSTEEHIENMSVVYLGGNPPYIDNTPGHNPIYDAIIFNAARCKPKYQSWIIPSSWFNNTDDQLVEVRAWLFNQGLKKIVINKWGAFEAKIATCIVFCEQGYKGDIEVEYEDGSSFSYDYRKLGFIINAKSKGELELLLRNQPKIGWNFSRPKNPKPQEFKTKQAEPFDNSVKMVKQMFATGHITYQYVDLDEVIDNKPIDSKDINEHRVIRPRARSGENPCTHRFATVEYIPGGSILPNKYFYIVVSSKEEGISLKTFLQSKYVTWILARTWATRTSDNPQLKYIPTYPKNVIFKNDQDIYDYFKLSPKEIEFIEQEENDRIRLIQEDKDPNNKKSRKNS